jgi:hypothetical protein
VSSRRWRVVIAGEGVSVEIGGWPVAGEHGWKLEKRFEWSVEVTGGQKRLPTVRPCVAGVGNDGGSGEWVESSGDARENGEKECRDAGGAKAREG